MEKKITYIAKDGTEFDTEKECLFYETYNDAERFMVNEGNWLTLSSGLYERLHLDIVEDRCSDTHMALKNNDFEMNIYASPYRNCISVEKTIGENASVGLDTIPDMESILFTIIEILTLKEEED